MPLRFPPETADVDPEDLEVVPFAPPQLGDRVITPPSAIYRTSPVRPKRAAWTAESDTVVVAALLGKNCGAAKDVKILKSVPGLDEAAQDCVRKWAFEPALLDGAPHAVWARVRLVFPPTPGTTP